MKSVTAVLGALSIILASASCTPDASPISTIEADALVEQLRELPASMEGICCGIGDEPRIPSTRLRREELYSKLYGLGEVGVTALARGLISSDVRIRRNSALALSVLGGGYLYLEGERQSALDVSAALSELTDALVDEDPRVRHLSAQAVGSIGPRAAVAVPELIRLLSSTDEGDRNTAAIGLRGIGPAARSALSTLRTALSDPSDDVRHFAGMAIESIEE